MRLATPSHRDSLPWGTKEASHWEFCQQAAGAFSCWFSRGECSPAGPSTIALWDPGQRTQVSCTWAPDPQKLWDNKACSFKPLNLLCSKRKLIHKLVKVICIPHSCSWLPHPSQALLPASSRQDLVLLLVLAFWQFHCPEACKSQKLLRVFSPSPAPGEHLLTLLILQTSTGGPHPRPAFLETTRQNRTSLFCCLTDLSGTSIAAFRSSGCNFLFTSLLDIRGWAKQQGNLTKTTESSLTLWWRPVRQNPILAPTAGWPEGSYVPRHL